MQLTKEEALNVLIFEALAKHNEVFAADAVRRYGEGDGPFAPYVERYMAEAWGRLASLN